VAAVTWRLFAACRGMDPDLFYPSKGDPEGVRFAKSVCMDCPVTVACLDDAIETGEDDGIRGGMSTRERRNQARWHRTGEVERTCIQCHTTFMGFIQSQLCSDSCRRERERSNYQRRVAAGGSR
jgi:protein-arginine kinase activator protein McsA